MWWCFYWVWIDILNMWLIWWLIFFSSFSLLILLQLDAKKSPLALLAQTCSSIGKPDPPPRDSNEMKTGLTAPLDIGGKKSPEKAATTIHELDRSSFKPYKQNEKRDGDAYVTKIAAFEKAASRGSPLSVITSTDSKPIASATTFTSSPPSPTKTRTESSRPSSNQSTTETVSSHTSTGHSFGCGAHSPSHRGDSKPHAQVSSAQILPTHLVPPALATGFKPSTSLASTSPTSGHCGCPSQLLGHHLPHIADPASISKDHAGHLLAATAGSPYATAYARVKTADGGTTLMPICRDPYCSHCQSASLAASAATGAACTQCRHDGLSLNGAVPFALPVHGAFPAYFQSGSPTAAATPYLYPPPPVPAQTEHGHVCNWVSGNTSCGKRFGSGEELLQHLRTHTMQSNESISTPSPYAFAQSLNAQLSAYYMHYPAAAPIPGSYGLSKPGVPQSPLSPGSALRYHPYKAPMPTSLATLPGLPAGAYYSPYAFHDLKGRLAAAGVPH